MKEKQSIESKIDRILHRQDYIEKKEKELDSKRQKFDTLSMKLRKIRKSKAKELEKLVNQQLADLMLPHAQFRISFHESQPAQTGVDQIEFQIEMNRQSGFVPLHKTASGGELSRLMLGLKCIFTNCRGLILSSLMK